MSDVAVRTARPSDVPAVAQVQAAVWRDAYAAIVDPEVLESFQPEPFAAAWRASLADPPSPRHRLLVATTMQAPGPVSDDAAADAADAVPPGQTSGPADVPPGQTSGAEQVVGFVAIGPGESAPPDTTEDVEGEILALGVHPDHRGQGHGSRLLNAAVDTLRAGDFTSVATWVLADAEHTRAFAGAAGLHPDGAYRDRVIAADGRTAREVRLTAGLGD